MFEPFITAIMVTGKTTKRYPLALRAVEAFRRQTYRNRRLLIINDHPTDALLPADHDEPQIREIRLANHQLSLGELRNEGVIRARGQYRGKAPHYLMQWDDDDFSHGQRMEHQVAHTPTHAASIFRWELHAHLHEKTVFANNGRTSRVGGFAGTMMWPASFDVPFLAAGKHEDTEFLLTLRKLQPLHVIDNQPEWYLRFYHGHNTWSEKHVMTRKPGSRDCTPAELEYFEAIYEQHYESLRHAEID